MLLVYHHHHHHLPLVLLPVDDEVKKEIRVIKSVSPTLLSTLRRGPTLTFYLVLFIIVICPQCWSSSDVIMMRRRRWWWWWCEGRLGWEGKRRQEEKAKFCELLIFFFLSLSFDNFLLHLSNFFLRSIWIPFKRLLTLFLFSLSFQRLPFSFFFASFIIIFFFFFFFPSLSLFL